MAKFYKHTTNFSPVLNPISPAPVDNRVVVSTKADLIASTTWDGYYYQGMMVVTHDTGELYILKDATKVFEADYSGWSAISSATGTATDLETLKTEINNTISENEEVTSAALNDLNTRLKPVEELSADYTISIADDKNGTYAFSQLGQEVATITLPKDMVVSGGSVVEVTYNSTTGKYMDNGDDISAYVSDPEGTTEENKGKLAGKYIRLNLAAAAEGSNRIYIKATDLVDVYTSGSTTGAAGDDVIVTVGADKTITAGLNQDKLNSATGSHIAKSYISAAITTPTATNTTITQATHGCGTFPMVQVYYGLEIVTANVTVASTATGDVTVSWEIEPSAQTPIRVRIVG